MTLIPPLEEKCAVVEKRPSSAKCNIVQTTLDPITNAYNDNDDHDVFGGGENNNQLTISGR